MLGVLVNSVAVIAGGLIGLLLGKAVPRHVGDIVMQGIALCIIYLGLSGAMQGQNSLVLILSVVIGAALGQLMDWDGKLNRLAHRLEIRFKRNGGQGTLAEGFVTSTLLMGTGALAVVGSLQAGMNGDNSILFTKATIDFVAAIIIGSTLGAGVMLTSVSLFVYQGFFALAGGALAPLLSDYAVAEITCAGSVLLIGLGLNILGLTKLKIMNLLPAVFLPMLLCLLIK